MPQFLLDTDHLTLYEHGHLSVLQRVASHPDDAVGVSAVTVEEALRGRLGYLARPLSSIQRVRGYALLLGTVQLFQQMVLIPFDSACEAQYQQLRAQRLRVGTQDLRIAAVALANNLTLLTRNSVDFGKVPGLVIEDWTV